MRGTTTAVGTIRIRACQFDGDGTGTATTMGGRHFLLLMDRHEGHAEATWPKPAREVVLGASALTELCPRWRQYCWRPIPADCGLAGVVRSHVAMLAEQAAGMGRAADLIAAVTVRMVAALLNSLDSGAEATSPSLRAFHKKRIKEFAAENLCDPELNVGKIANAVGLSERYVHQLFVDEPVSLMQWIIIKRLMRCRRLLADRKRQHWKISQIAYDAGFNDLAHFSRSFRRYFDVTPSQLRALAT